jgi:hypothetical protein
LLKMKVTIESEEAREMLERAPEAIADAVARALELAALQIEERVGENIRKPFGSKPPAVAFGILANSVFSQATETHAEIALHAPADVYGAAVEYGTRAHFPPTAALERWVMKKLGIRDPKEVKEVAFLVARAISKRGTKAHQMFSRAFASERTNVEMIMDQQIDAAIAELTSS